MQEKNFWTKNYLDEIFFGPKYLLGKIFVHEKNFVRKNYFFSSIYGSNLTPH